MTDASGLDPVVLAQALIRRASVTPLDDGAMDVAQGALEALGFLCRRMRFGEIENLYARRGTARPNLCFAGHTDVVPAGDEGAWTHAPFEAAKVDGVLYGRGAADMKGAVAAFIAAAGGALRRGEPPGSLSLLITGDEEGLAEQGTKAVAAALAAEGEVIDHCVVGEPTSSQVLGDMLKIGRRGSLTAEILVEGVQGHVRLSASRRQSRAGADRPIGEGSPGAAAERGDRRVPGVQPGSHHRRCGQPGGQRDPGQGRGAQLNIRFNPAHTGAGLAAWLAEEARSAGEGFTGQVTLTSRIGGEPILTEPGPFTAVVAGAVER